MVSQRVDGRRHYMALRSDDLDVLCPGLLHAVLAAVGPATEPAHHAAERS